MSNLTHQLANNSLIDLKLLRAQHTQLLSNLRVCLGAAIDSEDYGLANALHSAISSMSYANWPTVEDALKKVLERAPEDM